MMAMKPGRSRLIAQLDSLYSAGMPTLGARMRYWRKRLLWRFVIKTSLALKRILDITGAAAGLVALSPVFAVTALLIRLEDGGPVFFRQTRVGRHGIHFGMYKFRSMVIGADKLKDKLIERNESDGVTFKIRQDPRITRVGRVIRKLSIDELPQLWNVLKGDMSLVGPRPPVQREVDLYDLADRARLEAKPGITCLWQIGGRSELSFKEQVELDRLYIESQSLGLDLKILLKTIPAVISGRGAY
jgi:lipopolysaccharide/colanic/teichoic acid biosynthesis glycosyltransferase